MKELALVKKQGFPKATIQQKKYVLETVKQVR